MTDKTHTEVARLARVHDEELIGVHAGAAAQALLADVIAQPVRVTARTTRARPVRRLILAAATTLAVTTAVVAGPSLLEDGTGGATSYANSAIAVDREGGFFVARIKDPLANHARYAEAFRAVGLKVDIELVPVPSKLVGQLIDGGSGGDGPGGSTVMTEVVGSGPEPVDCVRQPDRCTIVIRIAAGSTGWMRFTVGRAAQPGEKYHRDCAPPSDCSGQPGGTPPPAAPVTRKASAAVVGGPAPREVTLPTGDRVLADPAQQQYTFRPAPGRERVSYRSMSVAGHHFVIPADAQVPLHLYDVTTLLGQAPPLLAQPETTESTEDVELTFVFQDRNGAAAADATTVLFRVDDPRVFRFARAGPDGTVTTRLPKGRYLVHSTVETARPGHDTSAMSVLVDPELAVGKDAQIDVDARTARPVSVGVPDRAAMGVGVTATYVAVLAGLPVVNAIGADTGAMFTAYEGSRAARYPAEAMISAYFARPGPDGTAKNSPMIYAAAWHQPGRFFTGFRAQVSEAELATVRAEYGSVAPGRTAVRRAMVHRPFYRVGFDFEPTATPFTRIERYAGAVQWANALIDFAGPDETGPRDVTVQTQAPTTYQPGRQIRERWNLAPLRPDAQVSREGDTIITGPALFGDQSGRVGTSQYRRARLELHRDGEPVGTSDQLEDNGFAVPPGEATYRLTAEAERDFTDLGTKVSATWTFRSAHQEGREQLPLPSVRYTPPVDAYGNVRTVGRLVAAVPVHLDGGGAVHSLTVAVSYDGGATWLPLPLHRNENHRWVLIRHPAGAGTVSLRADATDSAGNRVEQTLIHAYRFR